MNHLHFFRDRHRAGFTVTELMIVVAIIGICVALGLPSLSRARQQAQRTRLLALVKNTEEGFEFYRADNQKLPYESPLVSAQANDPYTVPPGMNLYMPKNNTWKSQQDGTWYYYYYPTFRPGYKGLIWLYNPTLSDDDIAFIDQRLDDKNTATGAIINFSNTGILYSIQ